MVRMASNHGAWSGVMAVLLGWSALGGSRSAEACEPTPWSANVVLPPAVPAAAPTNPVLLAIVEAPEVDDPVMLMTAGGVEVPVGVSWELTSSNGQALLTVTPEVPLEPLSEYVWTVGLLEHPMITGEGGDAEAPVPGEPVATLVDSGVGSGCSFEIGWIDYEIEVPGLTEPVATYAVVPAEDPTPERPYVRIDGALGSSVRVRMLENTETCFEVHVMDYGGNAAAAGTVCLEGPVVEGESSSGSDGTTSGDETGGDGTTAEPPTPTEPDSPTTSSTGADADTGPAQDDGDVPDRGCACQAAPRSPAGGLLVLLPPLLFVRRRARR